MRARAGDPPRTMAQKILAGRAAEGPVDQVILAGDARRALPASCEVEVAVAYAPSLERAEVPAGIALARAGAGAPGPVHLERFAAPARLALTDEPRVACVGGVGMLALTVAHEALAEATARGRASLPPLASIQLALTGRLRPFASARDVGLELLRRGARERVLAVHARTGARVVLEASGASVKMLSVPERALIASAAPLVGAEAILFPSDDRTASFLRDERRSKAHRALAPDPGAPFEEAIAVDLASVEPLVWDGESVRAASQLAGKRVRQVVLGPDGVTLRELFEVAALLKSRRVADDLDFFVAVPSRQVLEVLAEAGALAELIATGARLVESVSDGQERVALRTSPELKGRGYVASALTCAWAVASGELGDPRGFKRPPRVTLPRELPTHDVLIARKSSGGEAAGGRLSLGRAPEALVPKSSEPMASEERPGRAK